MKKKHVNAFKKSKNEFQREIFSVYRKQNKQNSGNNNGDDEDNADGGRDEDEEVIYRKNVKKSLITKTWAGSIYIT